MDFYAESQKLSSKYNVGDLTVTTKILALPNLPTQKYELENLKLLAAFLEKIEAKVGPFVIISGYRTGELQQALKAQGAPVSNTKSFHEVGRAVDIFPSTMDTEEFFARLIMDPEIRQNFSEVSLKPSQNSIHLAVNVPGDIRTPRILMLNANNKYEAMSKDQIEFFVAGYTQDNIVAATVADVIYSESGNSGNFKNVLIMAGSVGAAIFAFLI